ncbi:MAG: hypothetical protein AAF823_04185 [Planctomycetota bacterium]
MPLRPTDPRARPLFIAGWLALAAATAWLVSQGGPLGLRGDFAFGLGKYAAALFIAAESLLWLAPLAAAAGYALALRAAIPHLPASVAAAAGLAIWAWLALTLATLGLVGPISAWAQIALAVAIGGVALRVRPLRLRAPRRPTTGLALLTGLGAGTLAVLAACPPGSMWRVEAFGYDVLSYHLQLPREWLANGRLAGLDHNVYSHLPSLVESMALQLMALRGGTDATAAATALTAQYLHAALAGLTAWCLAQAVAAIWAKRSITAGGAIAAALFLLTPWVLVTGSMVYNEMAVTAFGVAAVALVAQGPRPPSPRNLADHAAVVGLLLGAAVLAKPTAGPMIAIPVLAIFALRCAARLHGPPKRRTLTALAAASLAAAVMAATMTPYLARNFIQRQNPIFPFATHLLGPGHWSDALIDRWDRAHGLDADRDSASLLASFNRQWLTNRGYGALGGSPPPPERDNVARFALQGGLPALWLATLLAAIAALAHPRTRWPTAALLAWLAFQLAFWAFATHRQSRFLIPTLLPTLLILGLGFDRLLRALPTARRPVASWSLALPLVAMLFAVAWQVIQAQTPPPQGNPPRDAAGRPLSLPLAVAIDAWPLTPQGLAPQHPVNALPSDTRTLVVADNSRLLYLTRPFAYATPFDPDPLGQTLRAHAHDPAAVTAALRDAGFTHVYLGWSELARLHRTYGYDPDTTQQNLATLIQRAAWQPLTRELYALPPAPPSPASPD